MEKSAERLEILRRIEEYEKQGIFDLDVEDDPPTVPIKPGEVDYKYQKRSTYIRSEFANFVAKTYFDLQILMGNLVIKEVRGMENYLAVKDRGVVITSNHFNQNEQYAVFKVIEKDLGRRRLYRVIREGNYTSFKGFHRLLFRNCNTLPLSANRTVFREFCEGIDYHLKRGEKVLIYPEQAMWWNYKKPRPLKNGAFRFAAESKAPVLPFFLTMEDTEKVGKDGFPIQAYTVHILPAIFPCENMSVRENARIMAEKNYNMWKEVYENFYNTPLTYTTEGKELCGISE